MIPGEYDEYGSLGPVPGYDDDGNDDAVSARRSSRPGEYESEGGALLMPDDEMKAQLSITEPRSEAPDVMAEGRVDCPCGLFSLGPCTGTRGFSLQARCPSCGRWLESVSQTKGDDE